MLLNSSDPSFVGQPAPTKIPGSSTNKADDLAFLQLCPRRRGGLPLRALRRVREYVEAHLEENINIHALAGAAGLSKYHFIRAFKQSEDLTPHDYLMRCRVRRAQELLAGTDLPISEIALASGFSDQSHFARRFRQHVGVSPTDYRWSMP